MRSVFSGLITCALLSLSAVPSFASTCDARFIYCDPPGETAKEPEHAAPAKKRKSTKSHRQEKVAKREPAVKAVDPAALVPASVVGLQMSMAMTPVYRKPTRPVMSCSMDQAFNDVLVVSIQDEQFKFELFEHGVDRLAAMVVPERQAQPELAVSDLGAKDVSGPH